MAKCAAAPSNYPPSLHCPEARKARDPHPHFAEVTNSRGRTEKSKRVSQGQGQGTRKGKPASFSTVPPPAPASAWATIAALFGEGEKIPAGIPSPGTHGGVVCGRSRTGLSPRGRSPAARPPLRRKARGSLRRTEMKLLLSARIHTPKPRITAPRICKERGA